MGWITVTVSDLEDRKMAPLLSAMQSAALGEEQDDPTPRLVVSVRDEIRRKIASWPGNRLDDDVTKLPDSLKDLWSDLVIFKLKGRLEIELTEDERSERRNHWQTLRDIVAGKEKVEQPDTPVESTAQGGPTVDVIGGGDLFFKRERTRGL